MTKTKRKLPQLLFSQDDYVSAWVAERIPYLHHGFDKARAIGVVSQGQLIAGVVYSDYQKIHSTIQLSIAASNPMWARKEIIRALLSYPFRQLNVFKGWIVTECHNEKSLRLTDKIGFKREATLAHHFGKGKHGIISRMFKPDYERLWG